MNILIINHYAGSPRHGMEFRPYYMAREWVKAGHRVMILAGSFSHLRVRQPDNSMVGSDEDIDGILFRWYKVPSYHGNGFARIKNILAFLRLIHRDARSISKDFEPDIVIASSTYPMDIWPARRIARLSRARLIFEVHDLWPLSPMEIGGYSRYHPFIMWVQLAEDYAYRHAWKVVSMLPKALPYMKSRGLKEDKFNYIPNGVENPDSVRQKPLPEDLSEKLKAVKGRELPIVVYAGSFGPANALDYLLDASKRLVDVVEIVMVGTGPEREHLERRVRGEALQNVHIFDGIPKDSVPTLLAFADIAYIGSHRNALYKYGVSPNKLMDYMIAAKPIVFSLEAGNDPVAEAKCGFTVPPADSEAIAAAITRLARMSASERKAVGDRGREYILENQTYDVLARRFIEVASAPA